MPIEKARHADSEPFTKEASVKDSAVLRTVTQFVEWIVRLHGSERVWHGLRLALQTSKLAIH